MTTDAKLSDTTLNSKLPQTQNTRECAMKSLVMTSLLNSSCQNLKERLNRSTNNADMECLILTIFGVFSVNNGNGFLIKF